MFWVLYYMYFSIQTFLFGEYLTFTLGLSLHILYQPFQNSIFHHLLSNAISCYCTPHLHTLLCTLCHFFQSSGMFLLYNFVFTTSNSLTISSHFCKYTNSTSFKDNIHSNNIPYQNNIICKANTHTNPSVYTYMWLTNIQIESTHTIHGTQNLSPIQICKQINHTLLNLTQF